jgi:hypothetical protein
MSLDRLLKRRGYLSIAWFLRVQFVVPVLTGEGSTIIEDGNVCKSARQPCDFFIEPIDHGAGDL